MDISQIFSAWNPASIYASKEAVQCMKMCHAGSNNLDWIAKIMALKKSKNINLEFYCSVV